METGATTNCRGSSSAWRILTVLALLGPSWQRVEQISQKPADPLVVVLRADPGNARHRRCAEPTRTGSAQTVGPAASAFNPDCNRRLRRQRPHLVPLSDDLSTSRNLLDALKPSLMPEAGHRADLAVTKALALLVRGIGEDDPVDQFPPDGPGT